MVIIDFLICFPGFLDSSTHFQCHKENKTRKYVFFFEIKKKEDTIKPITFQLHSHPLDL